MEYRDQMLGGPGRVFNQIPEDREHLYPKDDENREEGIPVDNWKKDQKHEIPVLPPTEDAIGLPEFVFMNCGMILSEKLEIEPYPPLLSAVGYEASFALVFGKRNLASSNWPDDWDPSQPRHPRNRAEELKRWIFVHCHLIGLKRHFTKEILTNADASKSELSKHLGTNTTIDRMLSELSARMGSLDAETSTKAMAMKVHLEAVKDDLVNVCNREGYVRQLTLQIRADLNDVEAYVQGQK